MISRRELLKTTAAAVPALAAPAFIARTADTLTIAAFGGEFKPLFIQNVIEPFEKKFSVKVTYDDSGGLAYFARIRAAKGSPGFDIAAQISAPDIILGAKENLLEKITEKEVPNLKYCFKKSAELIPPYGVIQHYQSLAALSQGHRRAGIVARLLAAGQKIWREGQEPCDRPQHGGKSRDCDLLADHGCERDRRQRQEPRECVGAAEEPEAVSGLRVADVGGGGALYRERPSLADAVLELALGALISAAGCPTR